MLGRLGERKGTYDLIAAVELAARLNPALTVCLAGDGEVEEVRALVAEKGLEQNISVPGWIDGAGLTGPHGKTALQLPLPAAGQGKRSAAFPRT